MNRTSFHDDAIAGLALFVRADRSAILVAWKKRIEALPASEVPSLTANGARVLEWLARSLEARGRDGDGSNELPSEDSFSAARTIAELALLAETINELQPAPLDDAARDALHR